MRFRGIGYRIRRPGWIFLAVWILVQLAAFNTAENLLYLVASISAAFLVVSAVLPLAALWRIGLRRAAPDSVHRGEPFGVSVRLQNRKRWLSVWYVQVAEAASPRKALAFVLRTPPRAESEFRVMQRIERRGVHPLPALVVRSAFPIGLFERVRRLDDGVRVVVMPRVRRLSARLMREVQNLGSVSRRWERDGDEYFGLREYVPGDDPRMVSWRVSARAGQLIVREMDPGTARAVVVELDPRVPESWDEDGFEESVDLAASIAAMFLEAEHKVALSLPGHDVKMGLGQAHLRSILKALAFVEPVRESGALSLGDGDWTGAARVRIACDPAMWGLRDTDGERVMDPREAFAP